MSFLGLGLAALLLLAVPASIAPASLVGAYVVLGVLALLAAGAIEVVWRRRHRLAPELGRRPRAAQLRLGLLTVAYAALVTVIHFAAR